MRQTNFEAAPSAAAEASTASAAAAAPAAAATGTVAAATAAASAAIADVSKKIMESPGLMVASVFVLLLIIFVIIYLYVKLKSNLKFYEVLSKPIYLNNLKSMTLASDSSFPKASGPTFTYAFWLFVNSVKSGTNYKLVMRRKDNPIIYMDPNQNKLYIRLKTVLADTDKASITGLDSANGINKDTYMTIGSTASTTLKFSEDKCHYAQMTVDYVPLQRWVHYAVVVDGDYIVVYQDGEIQSVLNLAGDKNCREADSMATIKSVGGVAKTTDDLKIGDFNTTLTTSITESPDAVLSRVLFFNYAITMQNAMDLYRKGPMPQNVLSQLGIPMYGVRSPFYRIDSVDVQDANATNTNSN